MAKPKLALIPASQGSKVFSVLPSSGVGDFDFSRSGKATRINSQGLIEEVANGQSRLNYPMIDGVVSGCPSLLLEPARTNLITYSNGFDNVAWVELGQGIGSAPIVTPNYAISPDGTLNASRLQCDLNGGNTTNDRSWLYQSISTITGDNAFSLYVKNNSNEDITFSLTNGSSETVVVLSDDKWHRLSTVKSGGGQPRIGLIGGVGASDNADLLIYGAQLEEGSYPTSYIPTNGTAVTRAAETANGAGDASTFNDSEGVLMAEISALADDLTNRRISISNGTTSDDNRINLMYIATSNSITINYKASGTTRVTFTYVLNDITNYNKVLMLYKSGDFRFYVNGFKLDTDSNTTMIADGTLSELAFEDATNSNNFYGKTKQLQYFQTALTDSELETLTSWVSFTEMAIAQLYTIE